GGNANGLITGRGPVLGPAGPVTRPPGAAAGPARARVRVRRRAGRPSTDRDRSASVPALRPGTPAPSATARLLVERSHQFGEAPDVGDHGGAGLLRVSCPDRL